MSTISPTAIASPTDTPFGALLRDWRRKRHLSQLALSLDVDVSARHISFLESGRSSPSRTMIDRLADGLDLPFPIRNAMLSAAGFLPCYRESHLDGDTLEPARAALKRMMDAHAPWPALIFDRYWSVIDTNPVGALLLGEAASQEKANLIETMLDDAAMRARILNWQEVAQAMMTRLRSESRHAGGDTRLDDYAARISQTLDGSRDRPVPDTPFMALRFDLGGEVLSLFSTVAEISSPYDITLSDVRLELFFPADAHSRAMLESLAS